MQTTPDVTPELVQAALASDAGAQRRLVEAVTPEIHWQAAKMLRRWRQGSAASRDLRQEVEDMVQEVFLELFKDDGKTLRRWDPERLPLEAFAGYVARIKTAEVLRSRRSPWRENPSPDDELDSPAQGQGHSPEDDALSQDELRKVYLCLVAGFKPDDARLFDLFFVRELPPQDTADAAGKSVDAVYKWRSRLYQRARECREKLSKLTAAVQRKP